MKLKKGFSLLTNSRDFSMDIYLHNPVSLTRPGPVSLILRSDTWEECDTCGQEPDIEIPLDEISDFITLLKRVEYELSAIASSDSYNPMLINKPPGEPF
jgi:hypothetical protein